MGGIEAALAEHAFEHLFIECLGWDRARSKAVVELPDEQIELSAIAQKRGFPVFLASAHRTMLADRNRLRKIQRKLRRSCHEHILIHYCEQPRKQVWQWATKMGDGQKVLHREHPFFSNEPPERLLERIRGLAVSFEEEEQTGLTDVLQRVRTALLPDAELNLFAKKPWYAAQSDRLAMAMKRGEPGAFGRFVEFHMPLARSSSKMLLRWFDMDPDDAEQTAMIGLLEAARRFDPDRGYQFSTYAGYWIRQCCQRYGIEWGMPIRVPMHWFWPCYRLTFERTQLLATFGEREGDHWFEEELAAAGVSRGRWTRFEAARRMTFFSEFHRKDATWRHILEISAGGNAVNSRSLAIEVERALRTLNKRQAEVLRLRYGIGGPQLSLEDVGRKMRVTRERIRQIQVRAEEKLENYFRRVGFVEDEAETERNSTELPAVESQEAAPETTLEADREKTIVAAAETA